MCNPKPQKRCMTDAMTALDKKVNDFHAIAERLAESDGKNRNDMTPQEFGQYLTDLSDIEIARAEVEKRKVFLYASSKAQHDPKHAIDMVSSRNKVLHPLAQEKMRTDENSLYRTGQYLNKFQAKAESYDKTIPADDDHKQVKVARTMYNGGFKAVHKAMQAKLRYDRDAKIGAILERSGSDEPNAETEEVEETYRQNMESLEDAYEYARRDAYDVVSKDIKDNSGSYFSPMQGMTTSYHKNVDGTFTVTTEFDVKARDYGSAVESIEDSFALEDVQITTSPNEDGDGYKAKSSYVYKGAETLAGVKKFHQEDAFKGTPRQRAVQADIAQYREVSRSSDS